MSKKLKFLISVSLKRKIKTKWFVITNIILFILIVGIANLDSVIKIFGGDFSQKQIIYVVDNTNEAMTILKKQNKEYQSILKEDNFIIKKANKKVKQILANDKDGWVIVIDGDNEEVIKTKVITNDYINTTDYAKITTIINNTKKEIAINNSNIPSAELKKITSSAKIERIVLDESKSSEEENAQMIIGITFPIMVLPFFALTIFLVQMIGAEVNDEKTTRGMEIIISNVSPKTHLLSKILAGNLFVLFQGVLLVIFALIGLAIRVLLGTGNVTDIENINVSSTLTSLLSSDIVSQLVYIIPLILIMMILTFIAYSLLAGILASMTTNIEDFQQLQTPIMVISLVGYYLAVMASMFEGSLFIKIFAFIPFISAILAPSLLVIGQFNIIEFIISIILVIVVIYLLTKYGFKVYKQGILNYSSKNLWKKMFKALKSK